MKIQLTLIKTLLLLISQAILYGQDPGKKTGAFKPAIIFDLGMALPASQDLHMVFDAGLNASSGPEIILGKTQRLMVQALGGMKWYFKTQQQTNSVTEHFRSWKAGIAVQYCLFNIGRFNIYPLVRIDQNWCSNYYSATYDYNIATNNTTIAVSDKYLTGNGISFDAGIIIQNRHTYLKIEYEYFNPVMHVNQDLINKALDEGFIIPPTHQFNFNSFNISLGIDLILHQ